jgi:hypothetical protein
MKLCVAWVVIDYREATCVVDGDITCLLATVENLLGIRNHFGAKK